MPPIEWREDKARDFLLSYHNLYEFTDEFPRSEIERIKENVSVSEDPEEFIFFLNQALGFHPVDIRDDVLIGFMGYDFDNAHSIMMSILGDRYAEIVEDIGEDIAGEQVEGGN